jgi:indolepyruvate ferredoxin oxidoreductase
VTAEALDRSLDDRYRAAAGCVHLTGIQALARLPIEQSRRDRSEGRTVGAYISGYEGSPLAGYDLELARQTSLLDEHDITFEPGLNEEAAAMAVQGSQLIGDFPRRVDGVVGYWYGKAPGLDRASDALRHANLMGTAPEGGAVAFVGDDPGAKSSSVPCASERSLADLGMPTFYPADPAEILEMGRHAVALSRASGLWTALKIVTAVADASASVDLTDREDTFVFPEGSHQHKPTAKLLQPTLATLERDFVTTRSGIVSEYARLNRLNPVVTSHPHDRVGVIAAGKTFLDVQEALTRLGLDEDALAAGGVRVLKLGLIWPLCRDTVRDFAEGLDEIIVVEEKRAFIEAGVRECLYTADKGPAVSGKADPSGAELFTAHGELDADSVAIGLAKRFEDHKNLPSASAWLARRLDEQSRLRLRLPLVERSPYFCSGCPHNTSTKPHGSSLVGAGIGCHAMVLLMNPKQVGEVTGLTQMGGEGTQWFGMAPYVEAEHFVQNLGDGTFHHSGSLAIRAAVASERNITYRILYNGAVAMTGGQDAVGQMDIAHLVANLLSEGVARIIVTTDDVKRVRQMRLPRSVQVLDRTRIARAEQILATTKGVSVLIHDQECATELRRKRKRGLLPVPTEAVVINERLCEGCGDCGEKSNCLSVHPIVTDFGRKTTIHQSSCNTDYTCLSGDCPAFMTVRTGEKPRDRAVAELGPDDIAPPVSGAPRNHSIRLMGIGGTGVVTTSQVLATAAFLAGRHVRTLDQTRLAQKGGAVVSDVKISTDPIHAASKIAHGGCDLYLGYDLLVATTENNLDALAPGATAIVSTSVVPTGAMVSNKDVTYPDGAERLAMIEDRAGRGNVVALDGRLVGETLFGAEQFANMFLLGIAYQSGSLSFSREVIEEAISLNGVAVEKNLQAFRRGRQFVTDPGALHALVAGRSAYETPIARIPSEIVRAEPGSELMMLVTRRKAELTAYQNSRYAERYERFVEAVRSAESEALPGSVEITKAVARYYFKLLAYKDEYEVARLAKDRVVYESIRQSFGSDARISWRLHPPTLRALGMRNKIAVGTWFGNVFTVLRWCRRLRGTPFDPFGYAKLRRVERRLASQYEASLADCLRLLSGGNFADVLALAELPDLVRGYEGVKLASVARYETERDELLERIEGARSPAFGRAQPEVVGHVEL